MKISLLTEILLEKEITPLIEKRWPKYNENLKKFILNVNESYEIVNNQIKLTLVMFLQAKKIK